MRIIGIIGRNSGPAYHRITTPLLLMDKVDCLVTNNVTEEEIQKGCDIICYNRVLPAEVLTNLYDWKEKYGFKIWVDIDDYWELDPHHVLFDEYAKNNFAVRQLEQLRKADIVSCTHDRLAQKTAEAIKKPVFTFPNAIPKLEGNQFDVKRVQNSKVQLFWQGSITHEEDLKILGNPIKLLWHEKKLLDRVQMVIGGFAEGEPIWERMVTMYTNKFNYAYAILPGIHVSKYYMMYSRCDIALVPLLETKFNQYKSNLKILEAANIAAPVICSPVNPYLNIPVVRYAHSADEWVRNIKRLVGSKARRQDDGAALKAWADEHFNFKKINEERKQVLEYHV